MPPLPRILPTLPRFFPSTRTTPTSLNRSSPPHLPPSCRTYSLLPPAHDPDRDAQVSALWCALDQAFEDYRSHKLAPTWLPFRPDASYWIPPCAPLSTILRSSKGPRMALSNNGILDDSSSTSWALSRTEPGPQLETDALSEETDNVFLEFRIEDVEEEDEEEETDN